MAALIPIIIGRNNLTIIDSSGINHLKRNVEWEREIERAGENERR